VAAQIFNLGKLRFTFKGAYNGATTYQLNDVVRYSNNVYAYINTGATAGNVPTNTSYWSKMVEGLVDPTGGTTGQLLSTNGTSFQFVTVPSLPSSSGNSGKILTTTSEAAFWGSEIGTLDITGDLEVATTSGALLTGVGARSDNEAIGTNNNTLALKSVTSNVATMTTTDAHGFAPFQVVQITCIPADARFDGLREIIATPSTTTFTFEAVTPNVANTVTGGSANAVPGYTNAVAAFAINANDYAQVAMRNASNAVNASSDFIAYANNGNDYAGYIDMGITSSNFGDPEFTITGPNDGYIFMSAPFGTTGHGNLVLATNDTGTENKIIFAAGGLSSNNTQMEITPDVNVHIEIPTPSTSPTTGALTVVGGVGIQGDVNIEGNITFGGSGTSVSTGTLSVDSSIIYVGNNNPADALDLGLVGEYTTGGNKRYYGVVRDASDGIIKFFKNATTKPTTTVNFSEGSLGYGDVQLGNLTTAGTITSSGILTVTGGAAFSGTTDMQELRENVVPTTISSNIATCDWTAGNIYYISSAPGANFTMALTNVPTDNDKIMTVNLIVLQGAAGYIPNAMTINGQRELLQLEQMVLENMTCLTLHS
jgi:hypothetical protein